MTAPLVLALVKRSLRAPCIAGLCTCVLRASVPLSQGLGSIQRERAQDFSSLHLPGSTSENPVSTGTWRSQKSTLHSDNLMQANSIADDTGYVAQVAAGKQHEHVHAVDLVRRKRIRIRTEAVRVEPA